jgi:hypothetical protein
MAKKSRKNTEDHQIFRISQFRHRFSPPKSTDNTHLFDYLGDHEIAALRETFSRLGLEINDPAQRDYVLALLNYGLFGIEGERSPGRPRDTKTWNTASKRKMIHQINGIVGSIREKTGAPPRSMTTIRNRLMKDFPKDYEKVGKDHLYNRVCELFREQKIRSKKK